MATSYKRSLTTSKRHLNDRLSRAKAQLSIAVPNDINTAQELRNKALELIELLEKSIQTLSRADSEWLSYCGSVSDLALQQAERADYDSFYSSDDNPFEWINVAEEYAASLQSRVRQLDTCIAQWQAPVSPNPVQPTAGSAAAASSSNRYMTVKPPKLALPEYDGDPMKWKSFWGLFQVNIHDRPGLSGVEKFSYLLPLLKGSARVAIDGLLVTEQNYQVAVDILQQRFDRSDDRLLTMLYGQFKRLPQAGNGSVPTRKMYDQCERIFRQMLQAGEAVDTSRTMSLDYLSKFHPSVFRTLERDHDITGHSSLGEVRNALNAMVSKWEISVGTLNDLSALAGSKGVPEEYSQQYERQMKASQVSPGSASETSALAVVDRKCRNDKCSFCDGEHKSYTCTRYATPQARIDRVKARGYCEHCTFNHKGKCANFVFCYGCKRQGHVRSICLSGKAFTPHRGETSNQNRPQKSTSSSGKFSSKQDEKHTDLAMYNESHLGKHSLYQTATVEARNPVTNEKLTLRLCLDTLSGRSYITETAAAKLQLAPEHLDKLCITVFGSQKQVEISTQVVRFSIIQRDGTAKTIHANTTKIITNASVLPTSWPEAERQAIEALRRSGALADNPFSSSGKVDVLIGADYAWDFIIGQKMQTVNDVSLIPTTLGMMLAGRLASDSDTGTQYNLAMLSLPETSCQFPSEIACLAPAKSQYAATYPDIDEYWKLETVGITDCPITNDDEVALQTFEETVQFTNGRYQVTLPWIPGKKELLPSNEEVARRRFRTLAKRFQDDPKVLQDYSKVIQQQALKGVIEEVPDDELHPAGTVHYLPHHPIIRSTNVTTKLRVVYDASAKQKKGDVSLNECLFKGPTILPDLCKLLIRFRIHPFVVVSDVEKAYLQVGLQQNERDVTRFLWFKDDSNPDPSPANVRIFRFTRVLFGVISSAFLLAATILHHFRAEDTQFAESLADDVYVDNLISGRDSEDEATEYYVQTKEIFRRAGMNLQQYCSNSQALMEKIPDVDKTSGTKVKVLGLSWDSVEDTLKLGSSLESNSCGEVTKRSILQTIASVFDPLGLFQPVLFQAKLFLQRLWLLKQEWDSSLPDELANEWRKLRQDVLPVTSFALPRYIGIATTQSSLIVFCDASKWGYGAAVYLKNAGEGDEGKSSLIFAKSRLAPLPSTGKSKGKSEVTIPRLELLAVTVAAKLTEFCRSALKSPNIEAFIFTDSMCVWHWLRVADPSSLKRFVANRVEVIRKVEKCQFYYVKTTENPADYLTRGKTSEELLSDPLWWSGPSWVTRDRGKWPIGDPQAMPDEVLRAVKHETKVVMEISLASAPTEPPDHPFRLNAEEFSSWSRLIKRTATCLIALKRLIWIKLSDNTRQGTSLKHWLETISDTMPPSADDYHIATRVWVKWAQATAYHNLVADITARKNNPLAKRLGLRLDECGVVRAHGRFAHAEVPPETKYPILLPAKNPVTKLLILSVHNRVGHSGVSHTWSEVRRQYWIPRGRAYVKTILHRCLVCRKYKSLTPFALPPMPNWPKERMNRSAVFQYAGLDYFGPVKVKAAGQIVKMWTVLFTCLATRAIHLEPVIDCTSSEFLQALIRFVSRRGCPHQIISDNAAQFHLTSILAERAWQRVPTDEAILSYAASYSIRWKFITELAPWQGGHYERLVGVVKNVLKTAIGRRLLTWTEFVTLLCETEAIVNSRPLSYVASDLGAQVLRPVDFLSGLDTGLGFSDTGFPVRDLGDAAKHMAAMWKRKKNHLDSLWKLWYEDYLATLRERGDAEHQQRRSRINRSPREGEVVIVKDEDLPRGCWKLARVTKLIESADGRVRSAEIKLANAVTLRRAVSFLFPLEVDSQLKAGENLAQAQTQASNDSADEEADEGTFLGFSQHDIRRTENMLKRFQDQ